MHPPPAPAKTEAIGVKQSAANAAALAATGAISLAAQALRDAPVK